MAKGSPVAQEPWEGTGPSLEEQEELAEGYDVLVKLHMKEEGRNRKSLLYYVTLSRGMYHTTVS